VSPGGLHGGETRDEIKGGLVISENSGPLDSPHHHTVEGVGRWSGHAVRTRIETRLARRGMAESSTRRRKMQRPPLRDPVVRPTIGN
jgi:hypothetical protein